MSSPDPTSLVALIVSLVALILSLLQVAQQYLGTASDHRHCSARTLGGWHKRRRRLFLLSELRFEVHFSTPSIGVRLFLSESTSGEAYAAPTSVTNTKLSQSSSTSSTSGAQYLLHTSEGVKAYISSQKPWFLDLTGTHPEAQCTWLSLLNATTMTHLQIGIDERTFSYDFMPDGIEKPLAQMDRKSFLTLMSLFQVPWQDGWGSEEGEKNGYRRGKRETPTGAGPYCEVSSRNLVNFGNVVSYQPSNLQPSRRFYIVSEKARSAMFNRFDLGFPVVLTHSAEEVYRSAAALTDEHVADAIRGLYEANNGYSPGVAEVISCFAELEMPKAIEHATDKFVSIFSGRSIGTIFDYHGVIRLLEGDSTIANSNEDAQVFAGWATDYLFFASSLKDDRVRLPVDQLRSALKFASTHWGNEQRGPIAWSESRKCLDVLKLLDRQSTVLCRSLAPDQSELSVHRELAQQQVRVGPAIFHDSVARVIWYFLD